MSLVRRYPRTPSMSRELPISIVDRWLGDVAVVSPSLRSDVPAFAPSSNAPLATSLIETDAAWVVHVAVPGLGPADVDVDVERRSLTVRARFRDAHAREGAGEVVSGEADAQPQASEVHQVHHDTLPHGEVSFRYRVPSSTDVDAIEARIDRGLLRITLPKVPEAKVRSIPVHHA